MFADIDHGFCFKPLYHIGVSKNISITFLREKGNGRTMQLVAVIYFRILRYTKIYDAINAAVGSAYTGWMKATWPVDKTKLPFWIWFPKLAESKGGKMVSAANDCVNTISDDWNELVYDDLKDSPPEDENYVVPPVLIFAKEPKGGPYIFRGVYEKNREKSKHRHHVYDRIGTRVKLVGQPSGKIEILDE